MGYDTLIETLIKFEDSELIVEWENGLIVSGKLDTVFETDNGLEESDFYYAEYDAAVFRVSKILSPPASIEDDVYHWLTTGKGTLIEISLHEHPPITIALTNGKGIWKRRDN
ncbi:hypothetical protein ACTSEZ_18270 [Metabacillus sp. JX24]|uniref:hypothetical protein n=1 Tax=Metabacillus sp. JX24 TaxID=3240759 RepID=UPI00350F0A7D